MDNPILVTGASGHFGRRVLHHLIETLAVPAARIVAASRTPAKLAEWAAKGVTTREFDLDNPAAVSSALVGVKRALLVSTDAIDRPGHRLEQHRSAVRAFEAAGVQHVVYTSAPNPENAPLLIAADHEQTEKTLAASGLPGWTVLRNHWYFENLFMFLPSAIASGTWYAADEGRGSADIARDDLALAAATVLGGSTEGKNIYTLSGSRALTKLEIASTVSAVINKPIEVVQLPLEDLVRGTAEATGLPEPVVRVFASFDTNTAAGRVEKVTGDFERITGRAPQSFENWVEANNAELAAL
ncbi:SDR family oxidoreductase [Paraburkholderia sp. MM5384-R2]|uniref:SDR family oxidoreductase n=1 Tax=Paraburkholderia sp. MM5384-R2 TaxID=2723097 RepID=UPI001620D43B|nr:SDR family oxidoreductase [Paraburkholderia sp. MM5384-R2]MBB5498707.1 NAD(P)H dehydrogenase (quinone) [Paraburkholderia sp. MM5384-R2]